MKRPRHYAAEIIALRSVEARRAALALVPSDYQDWVKEYVRDHFAKLFYLKQLLGGARVLHLKTGHRRLV